MAQGYWEVKHIEAVQNSNGFFEFTAVLDGPPGVVRVAVPLDAILDYWMFQREVLARAAAVYVHVQIEGRDALSANRLWKEFTDVMLRHWQGTQPATTETAKAAGTALN